MFRITYVLGSQGELRNRALKILLAALTRANAHYLRAHPETPLLYQSGVRYEEEPNEQDHWQDIPITLGIKHGDAEDLACWRAAELQVRGVNAWPTFDFESGCLHPKVRLPNGQIEDPSRVLGMKPGPHKPCMGFQSENGETRIVFLCDTFKGRTRVGVGTPAAVRQQELSNRTLQTYLNALMLIDMDYLREHPETPRLYDAGVRYELEPPNREDWQDVPTNLRRGTADCEDLAAHRAAELRVFDGIAAFPTFNWRVRSEGAYLYHIQTGYPDGRVEDPSRRLGMK